MYHLILLLLILFPATTSGQDVKDSDKLGMAIEYFQSAKYHESLLILNQLDKRYKLNPRFKAYMGICYFHDWDYKNASQCLDDIMEQLNVLAPQEQSVYVFTSAESHFYLNEYEVAIPLYEKMINLCFDNEKADALYRLGFCYMFGQEWEKACEYFDSALSYYTHYGCPQDKKQRMAQLKNLINGCKERIN